MPSHQRAGRSTQLKRLKILRHRITSGPTVSQKPYIYDKLPTAKQSRYKLRSQDRIRVLILFSGVGAEPLRGRYILREYLKVFHTKRYNTHGEFQPSRLNSLAMVILCYKRRPILNPRKILDFTSGHQFTDPRDRIYALLGLLDPAFVEKLLLITLWVRRMSCAHLL
jgi:hypothetical protein